MLFRILCLLTIAGWFQAHCYVTVPSIYRKVEVALQRYASHTDNNPVIYSLLNVLVYDERAKAFVTDEAIENALENVKQFNKNDEEILRQLIYGKTNSFKFTKPSGKLRADVQLALDTFFSHPNLNDHQTFNLLSKNKKKVQTVF